MLVYACLFYGTLSCIIVWYLISSKLCNIIVAYVISKLDFSHLPTSVMSCFVVLSWFCFFIGLKFSSWAKFVLKITAPSWCQQKQLTHLQPLYYLDLCCLPASSISIKHVIDVSNKRTYLSEPNTFSSYGVTLEETLRLSIW